MRRIGRVGLLAAFVACAIPAAAQQAGELAKLQRAQAANPSSVAANRALGIWYYKANRYAEARVPLEKARTLDPKDGTSALYAGLAAEQMNDFAAAKDAYATYLNVGKSGSVRKEVRGRLITVSKAELKAVAKSDVANEARISQQAPVPGTIAVLPFRFTGTTATLQPLERGMADLVVSDLAKSSRVKVLERDRMQAIADEIALSRGNQTDAATAVRAGKLAQAEKLVQGAIVETGGTSLNLNSSVIITQTSVVAGPGSQANGTLDQIFAMEKSLVLAVFRDLGITLTAAERQEVDRRPTQSLQAFLAYSRGLQAEDEGRLDDAARFFENARSLDPGFGAALQRAQSTAAAQQSSMAKVETSIKSSGEAGAGPAGGSGLTSTLSTVVSDVNPTTTNTVTATTGGGTTVVPQTRDAASEKTGTDQPNQQTGQVTIIIKRP